MDYLPAQAGWHWFRQGLQLFRQQPGAMTTLMLGYMLATTGLYLIAPIGPIIWAVLAPAAGIAFLEGCRYIDNGQRVTPALLISGMAKPAFGALCKLGAALLALQFVAALVSYLATDEKAVTDLFKLMQTLPPTEQSAAQLDMSPLRPIMLASFAYFCLALTMVFAAPLIYWRKMTAPKAMFFSFFAFLRSIKAMLVLLLAMCGMTLLLMVMIATLLGGSPLSAVIMLWMMFLMYLVLHCAVYCAYRQIFGFPPPEAPGTAPAL